MRPKNTQFITATIFVEVITDAGSLKARNSLRIQSMERLCFEASFLIVQRLKTKSFQMDERSLEGFLALPNVWLHSLQR